MGILIILLLPFFSSKSKTLLSAVSSDSKPIAFSNWAAWNSAANHKPLSSNCLREWYELMIDNLWPRSCSGTTPPLSFCFVTLNTLLGLQAKLFLRSIWKPKIIKWRKMFFVLSQLWDREKKSEFPRGIRIPRSDALLLSHRDWMVAKKGRIWAWHFVQYCRYLSL